jgi:arsenate reductase (glutaredoxin)
MGVDFEKVNYYIKPFSKNKLRTLLKKMNMKPSKLLRKNEEAYKQLKISENTFTEEQILNFMIENPNLIQRPIIEKGDRAVLARPIEKLQELF